jgi:hypothetical protein
MYINAGFIRADSIIIYTVKQPSPIKDAEDDDMIYDFHIQLHVIGESGADLDIHCSRRATLKIEGVNVPIVWREI